MTAVCSVGLDMIAVPGDTDAETLAALIADEVAIGVINHKTTAVRVIPVPGKAAGDRAVFGGLFGEMIILPIHAAGGSTAFVRHGGRIPARCRACGTEDDVSGTEDHPGGRLIPPGEARLLDVGLDQGNFLGSGRTRGIRTSRGIADPGEGRRRKTRTS